jgi:16S rRNA (guanine527-N7)-methyltransferase
MKARLLEGLDALGLGVGDDQCQALLAYLALVEKWGRVFNLTAVRDVAEMLPLHLMDSLAVLPSLRRELKGETASVLDVGSGAGLPGVVFAILNPALRITCVDTVGKKVGFIRQVGLELGLRNLQAAHARIEQLPSVRADIVVSRAFASLVDFVGLTRHHLQPAAVWMAMKGKVPEHEISALPQSVEVFHVEQITVPQLDAARCLVWMRPKGDVPTC